MLHVIHDGVSLVNGYVVQVQGQQGGYLMQRVAVTGGEKKDLIGLNKQKEGRYLRPSSSFKIASKGSKASIKVVTDFVYILQRDACNDL